MKQIMATALFWDVVELKMNVFMCLREEECDADLLRCARVSRTWMDLALDALWLGYPQTVCENNKIRTRAIALSPRARRQNYASRLGALDFTDFGGVVVHSMFDKLAFPRLKEVILHHIDNQTRRKVQEFRLSKYLRSSLQSLKLFDETYGPMEDELWWLTVSFLEDIAKICPNLEELSLRIMGTTVKSADLARFFQNIRPRAVSLDFGPLGRGMLTCDLLANLSHGGYLQTLTLTGGNAEQPAIDVVQLQLFLDSTESPFPHLDSLTLHVQAQAVSLVPQCFPAVTRLRLNVESYGRDETLLEPIANMSQLQNLEIVGHGMSVHMTLNYRQELLLLSVLLLGLNH